MLQTAVDISLGSENNGWIINRDDQILVTGAGGFVGERVVQLLLDQGFRKIRCLVRSSNKIAILQSAVGAYQNAKLEVVQGNLLSEADCREATADAFVIYHIAAGRGKSFPDCFLNSAITTRNLLDAAIRERNLKRFVNISSLAVYSNEDIRCGGLMDESCKVESNLFGRYDAYAYGKAKQDELVLEYARTRGLPAVIVRPGNVYGPGNVKMPGRVGLDSFGVFLHIGLNNTLPITYVDNCAEAIVLAGLVKGIEDEVINIVDDNLPTSREFLRMYKRQAQRFVSIPVPYRAFWLFSYLWEKYSKWSEGQLPPFLNRMECATYWKGNTYSNRKAKALLGWHPRVRMSEGLQRYFDYVREVKGKK
jgi:nucleoside-diphosphate-sugar epimerase